MTTRTVDSKDMSLNDSSTSSSSAIDISSVTVTNLFPDMIIPVGAEMINIDTSENINNISENQNITTATILPLSIDPKQLAHLVINSSTLSNSQKSSIIRVILCGGLNDESVDDVNQISHLLSSLINTNGSNTNGVNENSVPIDKKINFDLPADNNTSNNSSTIFLASSAIDQLKTSNDCLEPLLRIMVHKQQQQKINSVVNLIWNKLVTKMALTSSMGVKPSSSPISTAANVGTIAGGNAGSIFFPSANIYFAGSGNVPTANSNISHGLFLPRMPIKMHPNMNGNSMLNTFISTHDLCESKKKFEVLKPFLCSHPGCWRRFKHQTNLRIHSVIHGPQALHCRFCSKKFARKSNLSQHLRVHTGERPFICTLCNRGFKQLHSMKAHMQIHSRESCHVCSVCINYFQSASDLRKHQRLVHANSNDTAADCVINDNGRSVNVDDVIYS